MKKQSVFIYEVSTCNRRKLDASKLHRYFLKNRYRICASPQKADIIILVTCAYSNGHAKSSLQKVNEFLNYDAELIICGCLPRIEKEKLRKIFNGKTIGTDELEKIDQFFPQNEIKFNDIDDANVLWENVNERGSVNVLKKVLEQSKTAYKIHNKLSDCLREKVLFKESPDVQNTVLNYLFAKYIKEKWNPNLKLKKNIFFIRPSWGCLGNCSYCVIKKAIGPLKSKKINKVINEFKYALKHGYQDIVFDADDLGAYGLDIGSNLPQLLDKITNIPGDYKIHIRNVHPIWLVKYANQLARVLKKGKIQGCGCSIQSGNPRVLKLMQRFSDIQKIKNTFYKLIDSYPDLLLATEFINGFPTETKAEFKDTLNLIREVDFFLGYIFPFSCRPNTSAEKLEPKVSNDEILARMKYAKKYLRNVGYDTSILRKYNILFFSRVSPTLKLNEEIKSFCLSTID